MMGGEIAVVGQRAVEEFLVDERSCFSEHICHLYAHSLRKFPAMDVREEGLAMAVALAMWPSSEGADAVEASGDVGAVVAGLAMQAE
jgi:hypothetical protein